MARTITYPVAAPRMPAVLELLKPITWFPPMWAFMCGLVAAAGPGANRWTAIVGGMALTGPLVCGTSQAVNDWFDRHVDAINEPQRPIPSGRLPGRSALYVAILWTVLSLVVAAGLGSTVFVAALAGMSLAWAYSAPPFRLKRNGWWGNSAVAVCYEGLPWVTGAAVMAGGTLPPAHSIALAALYSIGAHGIMTLNDFKSVDGDRQMGIDSLPVKLGEFNALAMACFVMALPQAIVIGLLAWWGAPVSAAVVGLLWIGQLFLMERLLDERPKDVVPWYNATGVTLYVLGMLVSANALRLLA
jgi:chlorophyll/bacteriochlorophyll a synthase